jgi:DNA-binding transcriptional ArsR family regulator
MAEDQVLDQTYAALADPTRRALPMSFAGVSRHVGVLEAAGLIRREVRGRGHWLSVQPEAFSAAGTWITEQAGTVRTVPDERGQHGS